MKRFQFCVLLILSTLPVDLLSQVYFGVSGGLGTYSMDNLKEINKMQAKSLLFETVTVDNFNSGLYFGASIHLRVSGNFLLGLNYQYNSTGSRIGQKDYSGYYVYDQIVNGSFLGIEPGVIVEENHFMTASLSIQTGVCFTSLKMREEISVSGQDDEEEESFSAISVPFYPAVKLSMPVFKNVAVTASLGYLIDSGGNFHLPGQRKAIIKINDRSIKTGWSGLRMNIGLNYYFNKTSSEKS